VKETRLKPSACLNCGKILDAASDPFGKQKPRPGDITICIKCGHVMAFNSDLQYRELTSEEILIIAGNKKLITLQKARAEIMKEVK
jgi:hypothetical protein